MPIRYPVAVGRGLVLSTRTWWDWVRVSDFYTAAKSADKLADRYDDIQSHRVRRCWWTLGTLVAGGTGLVVAGLTVGPIAWWIAGGAVSAALAGCGTPQGRITRPQERHPQHPHPGLDDQRRRPGRGVPGSEGDRPEG